MSNVNTISYNNILIANGISYNIKFITPDAKTKGDPNIIRELVTAILCSHFDKNSLNDLTTREITETKIEYNPKTGALIGGSQSDKAISEIFLKNFSENEGYKGMNVAENEPIISGAIEDLYNTQTSESVSGTVAESKPGWMSWMASKAAEKLGSWTGFSSSSGDELEKALADKENLKRIIEICNAANKGENLDPDAKKFFNGKLLGLMQKDISDPNNPNDIARKFMQVVTRAIEKLNDEDSEYNYVIDDLNQEVLNNNIMKAIKEAL